MKIVSKETIQTLYENIAHLTGGNHHTHSVLKLAEFLKEKDAITDLNDIIEQHNALRYMPESLIETRTQIRENLLEQLRDEYGEKEYRLINSAF